jgi:hypothetical protein
MVTRLPFVVPGLLALASALAPGLAAVPSALAGAPWSDGARIAIVANGAPAPGPSVGWFERVLGRAAEGDVMVCVLDPTGQAQCHHRDGVTLWAVDAAGRGTCPGADRRLRARCEGDTACVFENVPVPSGPFALLLLSVEPPVFGVPRHRPVGAAVFAPADGAGSGAEDVALRSGLSGLAQCLGAPGGLAEPARPIATFARGACETGPCRLGRATIGLTRGGPHGHR